MLRPVSVPTVALRKTFRVAMAVGFLVFASVTYTEAQTCVQPPAGLVAWWPGDGNADDIKGGANGTLGGTATFGSGKVGQAFSSPGSGWIEVAHSSNLEVPDNSAFSIEAWVYPTAFPTYQMIIDKGNAYSGPGYSIGLDINRLLFQFGGGAPGSFVSLGSSATLTLNQWHHVAATYDGTIARVYVNGAPDTSLVTPTHTGDVANSLNIGRRYFPGQPSYYFHGSIDEESLYQRALTPAEVQAIFNAGSAGKCKNVPPIAEAGPSQSIHAGQFVNLDGSGSSDDNTASQDLIYQWNFSSKPAGSNAVLTNPDTAMTSFFADLPGDYVVSLVVTDESNLASAPDEVMISSLNAPPNADAGPDQGSYVGYPVQLNGSGSNDPDFDAIGFSWTLISKPVGSLTTLSGGNSAYPTFVPDLPGAYVAELIVNDGIINSAPDQKPVSVSTAEDFAEVQTVETVNTVGSLPPTSVTTPGNQSAFGNFLTQAIAALQSGNIANAKKKLEDALERTDGCALRGSPDFNGGGQIKADYINNCPDQQTVYPVLKAALDALGV